MKVLWSGISPEAPGAGNKRSKKKYDRLGGAANVGQ